MTFNFKAFGGALLLTMALGVVIASAASASNPGTFSADSYPVQGHGEPTGAGGSFTLSGNEIKCEKVLGSGEIRDRRPH
jgi:hypothetical protein